MFNSLVYKLTFLYLFFRNEQKLVSIFSKLFKLLVYRLSLQKSLLKVNLVLLSKLLDDLLSRNDPFNKFTFMQNTHLCRCWSTIMRSAVRNCAVIDNNERFCISTDEFEATWSLKYIRFRCRTLHLLILIMLISVSRTYS